MRLLANENFPGDAVEALRKLGHNVLWILLEAPGSSDQEVLARAQEEDRILLTFDKDFGELAFKELLPASSGVILFRITATSSKQVARAAVTALESEIQWEGNFSVVEDDRIRVIPLPPED
jgi:predicted nuclease of predicted toxin-antitoxin system